MKTTSKDRDLACDFGKKWPGSYECEFDWKDKWCYECDSDVDLENVTKEFWGRYYKCTKCNTMYYINRGDKMGGGADGVRLADMDDVNESIKEYPDLYELAVTEKEKRPKPIEYKEPEPSPYTKSVLFDESILDKTADELEEYIKGKKVLVTYKAGKVDITLVHFSAYDGKVIGTFKEYFSDHSRIKSIEIFEKP